MKGDNGKVKQQLLTKYKLNFVSFSYDSSRWSPLTYLTEHGACFALESLPALWDALLNTPSANSLVIPSCTLQLTGWREGMVSRRTLDMLERCAHEGPTNFNRANCKVLHLGWGNSKQKYRLGKNGLRPALRKRTSKCL